MCKISSLVLTISLHSSPATLPTFHKHHIPQSTQQCGHSWIQATFKPQGSFGSAFFHDHIVRPRWFSQFISSVFCSSIALHSIHQPQHTIEGLEGKNHVFLNPSPVSNTKGHMYTATSMLSTLSPRAPGLLPTPIPQHRNSSCASLLSCTQA